MRARAPHIKAKSDDPRRAQLARLREEMEREEVLADGAKSEFWAAVKAKIVPEGIMARQKLGSHDKMGPEQRAIWLERFLRYEWFLQIVERAPRNLEHLQEKYATIKADLEKNPTGGSHG